MKRSLNPMLSIALLMTLAESAAPRSDYTLNSTRYAGDPPTKMTGLYISDGNGGTMGGGGSTASEGEPGSDVSGGQQQAQGDDDGQVGQQQKQAQGDQPASTHDPAGGEQQQQQ